MKQEVITKLTEQLEYINNIITLKEFWKSNRKNIEKIIAHYFSFQNPQNYQNNKEHYNHLVNTIIDSNLEQNREKITKLIDELNGNNPVENYIELLNKQLSANRRFSSQQTTITTLNQFNANINIDNIINDVPSIETNHQIESCFSTNIQRFIPNNIKTIVQILSNIELFDLLKNRDENLTLIGANGSGKSTFSRQIKQNLNSNFGSFVAVILAQKTFNVTQHTNIPLKAQAKQQYSISHTDDKLFKNSNAMHHASSEFEHMINYLIAEYQEKATNTHQNYGNSGFAKENSILENVIDIWQTIITHIKLEYDGQGNIKAIAENGNEYDFMNLSDGEKNIFFCIASVLTVDENGYVIVDEPENHLNMSIVNKLWDKLESIRSDCQFVYLTHNPSFAIGRAESKILWIKKYTPPSDWDYEEINVDATLPQQLMVELIGSKKKILFCEGERDSYDYKLYSVLFKNYTIVPAGGHQKAIDYCKAFNENIQLSELSAIAIIDKDFYGIDEIEAWKGNNIFTLDVMEVENLLCNDNILKKVQTQTQASGEEYESAKAQIFTHIKSTKDKQSLDYAKFKTDKILSSLVGKASNPEELKEYLTGEMTTLSPKDFYDEHTQLLDDICSEDDYDKALAHYNNKGMLSFVGDKILKGYKDRVINFIRDDEELQQKLLDKYFSEIPKS
jgi:ABC-type cobalamin/Fe3+-siderophores transport system ATPase subunit